jgi:DNA-binding MarR family transcriptional regulator
VPRHREPDPLLVARLSLSVTRLARVLRQQETSRTTPAAAAALATIVRQGPISLGDLAAAEQVSPSTITKIVGKLEANGLIERVIDPADRRVHRVQLSARGRRSIDVYRSKRNAWLSEQLTVLDDEAFERVIAAVDVLERLTAFEGEDPLSDVPRH